MDWSQIIQTALMGLVTAVVLPLAGVMVQRYVKDANLAQFATGAMAAAGRAATVVQAARQANPSAPLASLVDVAARAEAVAMLAGYRDTVTALGATQADAISRVKGELGKLLAPEAVSK